MKEYKPDIQKIFLQSLCLFVVPCILGFFIGDSSNILLVSFIIAFIYLLSHFFSRKTIRINENLGIIYYEEKRFLSTEFKFAAIKKE